MAKINPLNIKTIFAAPLWLLFIWLLAGPADAAQTLTISDSVIRTDTTWSGTINIKGVVVVSRKATLTIKPGTQIKFKKIDRNNDGIGDGEIRVIGRILAEGNKDMPITFESGEKSPQKMDWSYLLIFSSGAVNKLQFCRFRDGFSGLQVHFSTASVTDSLFEENNEGIRFGRAKLTIAHNLFKNNDIGIRFTRMEGPVEIHDNEITANQVGIFLVPSGQNIRDFFEPGRDGKAWNEGHLAIYQNNIYENGAYNLKLGAKQKWDLMVANNWWGKSGSEEIKNKIFDHNRDSDLGEAKIEPTSSDKYIGAGIREKIPFQN